MRTFREISMELAVNLESKSSEVIKDLSVKGILETVKTFYLNLDTFVRKPAYLSKKITDLILICENIATCCIGAIAVFYRKDISYAIISGDIADFYDINIDYGEEFIKNSPADNFLKIKNKYLQLERLMLQENPNPNYVEYTLRDLASFCIMVVIAMENTMEKNKKDIDGGKLLQ